MKKKYLKEYNKAASKYVKEKDPMWVAIHNMALRDEQQKKILRAMPIDEFKKYAREMVVLDRATQIQERKIHDILSNIHDCCPHDEGILRPHVDGLGRVRPRNVYCSICEEVVGRYCKVNQTHICEYKTPDKKAHDYHDICIHCGLMDEEGS